MERLFEGTENTYMFIEANYRKGGMNYFHGKEEVRGYELNFSTKEISKGFSRYSPMNSENFRIFIQEAKRSSQKKMDNFQNTVESYEEDLFDMYASNNRAAIFEICKQIGKEF